MGNPSPGSKLKKTTTPPPKTIHRRAPSVTSLSLDHSIGKDVASPEKSNGAGRSVASIPSSAGGSGEKGISPAAKDSKLRRRIRSSLGGSEDFVLGDDFNNAGTPPAEEKRITSPAEDKKSTPPPMEEKKHPFLLARGGIGRNGIRSGSPSQPLQSQAVKPRITTPPSKEKTALGRAASASTYSPKKLDMNSKKGDKEVSLTKSATAKSVKVQGDSVAIGRPKQNQSVKLHATRKLVAGENSCLPTSSDMLTSSKPDLGGSFISEPLASEDSTRPEIMESVEVPVYSEGEPEELISMEVDHAEDVQLHLPILDTEEKTAAVSTNLQPSLEYAQEEPSVHRLKSETSFGQDNDIPNYLPSEEESNPQVNLEALHSSDTELTSASLTSLMPPSFQGIHVEQEGQVARPDYDFAGCPPSEEVTKFEEIQEGLESADTDESKTLRTLKSIPFDLSGQKQGLNDTDVENAVVSTMNHLSTCKLPDNASSAQEHQVDLNVADTRRSASTCAISSESSAFKLAGAQEEVFSRPAISEELRVSRKDILTGFSSEVLSSPEVSHTPIIQQEFGKIDASNNAVATFQQEVVGLPSDTSLEWSTTLHVDEDHDMSRDLNKAGSLCVALMPNLVCHSAEDSGSGGDVNQNLTAPTRQNDLLYPSKDVESHKDVDLLEQDSHELRTGTTAFPLDALYEVILPLDNDQETYKNQLYTFHSGTLIDSLDGFHDVTSEQTTASSICTQETGIQAGASVLAQQPELGLEEAPYITNANQELSASMGITPIMFNISPALDTSPELCNASPVLSAEQECEATSDSAASFFKETWSSSDDEGAAKISKELTSFASDAGDANFVTFSGESANKDLGEAADIQDESCQDSVTRVMDLNRSVEFLDCPKSEKGNTSRVQEVLEEGLTNDRENCKFAEEATHSVDEESTDCLLPEPLNCPKSDNETSPKIQEISEEGLTNIPDKGACAEKARHRLDEGITHSLPQEPLDCLENCTSPELQELSEEGLTCIPDKAVACAEEARQTVDEGRSLSLLLELLDCPKSENATSKNIQELSDNGLADIAENGAHADEARHGVNEGRKAGLVQDLLDSRNGTSPKIKEVSKEGVINTPEKGTCAEEATDSVGEGITPCLLQEQLHCQKSGNNISLESQEVSGVTITLENGSCAPETVHSVDEGSTTSLLKESSLIPVEMGVGAPVVFAEDILRETGSAVQKDLIPADGGEPTKEVPHATGDVKAPAPAAGNVQPLHVDTQAEAVVVVLHQELGGDEKVSSTTSQDLLACEVLRDTDNVLGDLGMAADPGVAQSPMKPVETRPTTVAGSDTVFGMEAGESPVSMDCMFGSAAEDKDEGQIERLDSIESLHPELSTEEDPGNLKDDESSGSSLLQNDLASFQGLVSLNDHADFTSDVAEKSDTSNMSEASLDMPEGGRVADVVLHLSTEHDPTIENSSAIPPQGPVMDRDPTLVVGTVATNTSMVASSIPDNGERGEHHSDPVYLGESQKPEVSEVNLCKQEEDIAGEVAAHMTPPLETRHAPTLQEKSGFHPEESMVEDIVGKGVDPFAREVYLEAHPVETPGNEENLSCLNKLPTSHEVNESDTMVSVATQDNFERHLQESFLEMLKDERSQSNVKQREQWSLEEQYMFVAAGSNDSAVSMESLDSSEALPMTNQERREESSAEVLEILEDDRSDNALKEQEQRSFEEQPMFSTADSNGSDVLMGSLDNSEAFSVANLEKQEESSADTLEMLEDDGFESEADYQEQRSLEEQPTFVSADSNDSAVLMKSLDNSEVFSVINHEKQEESSVDAPEMHKGDRFESEVDYQEQRSLEEQPTFISADSNYPAVSMENLHNTEPFPMTSQEKQQESSAEALGMQEDDRPAIEVNYQEQWSLKEQQLMFVAADSNDSAGLIESLDNSDPSPVANQEKQEESSAEALEMLENARSEHEVSEQEVRYVEEEQAMFVAANSNDSAMLMKSLHNSGAFPMTNQEKQEERTAEGPEMLEDARAESEVIEQEQRSFEEKQSKVFAADHNDSALLTVSLDNSGAFPMNNQEKQDGRAESKAIEQEQRSLEEKESKVFAGDSNDTAVLTRSLDNSEAFPMTSQEKQDKSSAESLEMAEDDRLESEVSEEEQMVLEEQPMLVASDSHDSALVTENLDNPETFLVTNQEKQEESSAKALEILQNNRSEMEAKEQEKSFLEEQSMFVAVDSNDSAVLTESLNNSEAFPVTNWEQQEESSAEALELPEDSRSESEVVEQEQRSAEKEWPMFADSNDSVVLMESRDNSKAFPVTNHEKEEETSACLEIPVDDRSEMEVQEQENGSLGEQSIFVVADRNDPVTNQEKQEEVSAEGLEMLEVVRCENGLSEQEQRSVEEEQPMFVATDSAVLVEGLDNSDTVPVTIYEKQEESSAEGLEMLENDGSEMEVQEEEKGSLVEQPMFVAASSNDSAVLMESRDSSEALQVTNQEKQEESSAEAREMIEVGGFENEASVQEEQRSIEEKQAMFGAADSNDSAVLTEGQDTSEALPVTDQEKQEESSAEPLMIEVGRFEDEASEQEQRSVKEKQAMFGAADNNDSAVLMESEDSSEPLPMTDQEEQEESSAEAQEVIEVGGFENEAIQQEQRSVEEKQTMFVAADSNDSAVLTESQDTSDTLPVTNQEMQEDSSPECLEMLEDDRSESEIILQEQRSVEEKQFMFGAADSNDSAVWIESQDSSEALPVTNQEKQEESSAEALEMVEVGRFEHEASEQEQRSVEEKQTVFVAADSNDSAVLTESRDTSEALPMTIQEKQEESSAEPLMIEVASFENEASKQEQRSVQEKQTVFVAANSNDLAVLTESQDTSEALPVTIQEKQEESSAEPLMIEVASFENEASEQEQRSVEEKQTVLVAADSNDSAVLTESRDTSEALPVTIQDKQEESSTKPLMMEVASFENEASEQEQRSVEEKQTMFVGADSDDLAVLTESRDTSESFPFTNQETQEESSPEALEMLEHDRAEGEIIQQEQRYLEEKQPIFVAADSNDSAVLMESLENSKPCPATNQEKQDESSAGTLEMLEDARFETEVNEQEKRSAEQTMSSDTNYATVLLESIDNSEAFPETNQEKQEESSAEVAADVLPSFQTSHVPAMQDSSVCPAKGLVTDDGVGEEVHPITSLEPVVPSGVTPENKVEELDNKEYSVSGYSTELFEELAKSEGFDRVNGMDEQGQMLASDEASQLYSQLQTRHVLSIQDSSFDQAEETSDENAGEVVDPDSRHSLKGASPIITGGNEQDKRSGEADRSFDGNIDVGSVPAETNAESIDFNKQNSPSQPEISCDGAQAQNNDLIMEVATLDCREPCEKVGHDNAIGSETAETNSEALPLSGSRQPMEHSCNVSQASSPTYSINDEFPASHQNGMHRDSSSDVTRTQTADQDDSATGLKAVPLPEKSCLMANGQSKSMVSELHTSGPETAGVHEAAPTLFPELGEQPLSSSHQDHLWEEQAETYPKGSGVTAAHLEEAAIDAIHSLTPSATSPDDQILPALGPVMSTLPDVAHSSTVENGSTIDGKTEKGKSRTQLRNLLAEDASMVSNGSISTGAEDSPLKRLFSRLMGNPTKLGEKEIKQVKKRKPSVWNACLGVPAVR